jgi:hypothetical protein
VEIITPGPEAVLQNTGYTVEVSVLIEPGLGQGHQIVPVLDGTPLAPRTEPQFELAEVYRGSHSLQVTVQDAAGQVLASSPEVTFYVHQMSRLFPHHPLNPSPSKP